jgi:DNA-binding NtrC family response regulator
MVEQVGGTIIVDSEPGRGTTFFVLLPLSTAATEVAPPSVPRRAPFDPTAGAARILVVDDDPTLREAVCRQLENRGFVCVQAEDGASALRQLKESPSFELVITDVIMPRMGGMELLKHIQDEGIDVRVLLMSGYSPGDASLASAERYPLLTKPFTAHQLFQSVGRLL